jgi:hypothetical protein
MSRAGQAFDRELFILKLSELSHQMRIKSAETNINASVVARLAGGSVLEHILDAQAALLSEWVQGVDRIAREVWKIQGGTVTPAFVREVLVPEAMTQIETRASVAKWATDLATPEAETPPPEILNKMVASWAVERQAAVANRYEIEVRELEYRNVLTEGLVPEEEKKSNRGVRPLKTVESKGADRRAMTKAYIEEVRRETGKRITKKDIWNEAGYQTRTEFERWERRDPKRPNRAADDNFTRILREKPHLK